MGRSGRTSLVGEAIAAAQLYFHRYLVNLESNHLDNPDVTKQKIKLYWQWMKNFRLGEANRKVFLYPQNYLRPELRNRNTKIL